MSEQRGRPFPDEEALDFLAPGTDDEATPKQYRMVRQAKKLVAFEALGEAFEPTALQTEGDPLSYDETLAWLDVEALTGDAVAQAEEEAEGEAEEEGAAQDEAEAEAEWEGESAYQAEARGYDESEWKGEAEVALSEVEWGEQGPETEDEAAEREAQEAEDFVGRFDAFGDERDAEWELGADEVSFEDEGPLAESGLSTAEQRAVEITSLFETGKRGWFYGLSGNFDGQGLSFGLVNWTIGTGSLQPLLRDFAREQPTRWAQVFGPHAPAFLTVITPKSKAATKVQLEFAREQMNTSTLVNGKPSWSIKEPWVTYFKRLSEDREFQQIQVRYVRDLLKRAEYFCQYFKLKSEMAFAYMFDAVSSHGKWWLTKKFDGREKRRIEIETKLAALTAQHGEGRTPEADILLAIADVLSATSAARWAARVRRRKRWFVTGEHQRAKELKGLEPRADVPYTTSAATLPKAPAGELEFLSADSAAEESDEADIAGESETASDAKVILGKWTVRLKDWVWEYEFSPGGRVTWRDTRSSEKGEGRWAVSPKAINISWTDSATTESWARPLTPARQMGWYKSTYYTGAYQPQKVGAVARGGSSTAVPAWADAIDPFPASVTLDLDRSNALMTTAFAPVTTSSSNHLCAALADVTSGGTSVPFAAHRETEMVYVGSLLKMGVMFAAFALRARVQVFADAARANGVTTAGDLFGLIKRAWTPKLKALFPGRATHSFGNGQDVTVPQVDRIFTLSAAGRIEFAIASPALTAADLDRAGEFGAPVGRFHEWMRLMMRWSNNAAASRCVLSVGYFYINGLFARSGFFDAGKGLWISGDYAGHDWVRTATERSANAAGVALDSRWATAQKRTKSNFVGNALQIGRLMGAMAQDKLVDVGACDEMRRLANQLAGGIGSYAGSALTAAGRKPTALSSKIGFGDDSFSHDCAIVERTVGGKRIRYAAVVLGSAPAQSRGDLSDLFVLLDAAVVARNP